MNGFTDKCFECKYFSYVDKAAFNLEPKKYGRFRDGLCNKVFPRGYTNSGKKGPWIKWSGQAACFQFEPKDNINIKEQGKENSNNEKVSDNLFN